MASLLSKLLRSKAARVMIAGALLICVLTIVALPGLNLAETALRAWAIICLILLQLIALAATPGDSPMTTSAQLHIAICRRAHPLQQNPPFSLLC